MIIVPGVLLLGGLAALSQDYILMGPGWFLPMVFAGGLILTGLSIFLSQFRKGVKIAFRDGRKKTASEAFNWLWKESFFQSDYLGSGQLSISDIHAKYAYQSAVRALSSALAAEITHQMVNDYLQRFSEKANDLLEQASKGIDVTCALFQDNLMIIKKLKEWSSAKTSIFCYADGEGREIEPGVKEVSGGIKVIKSLTCRDIEKGGRDVNFCDASIDYVLPVAKVQLMIKGVYIQNGEYWVPFDIMPEIKYPD